MTGGKNWLLDEPPEILRLEGAIATPIVPRLAERAFSGCIHERNGTLVRSAQRFTGTDFLPVDPDAIELDVEPAALAGESLYLGQMPNHYGHFLLETLSRFWAAERVPVPRRYLFHRFILGNAPNFPRFVRLTLDAFGIPFDKVCVIDAPVRTEVLHVPTPLYRINRGARPEFRDTCRRVVDHARGSLSHQRAVKAAGLSRGAGRYFLSRTAIPLTSRAVSNEREVQAMFESFGFEVLQPEKIDYAAQLVLYGQASVIAGFTGSALHNVLYCPTGTRVIDVADARSWIHQSLNQQICDWVSGAEVRYLPFQGTRTSESGKPVVGEIDLAHLRNALEQALAT